MRISDWSSDVCSSDLGKPFNQTAYAVPTTVINRLNDRVARDAEIERLQEESADPYVETRSLYLEMRQREIDVLRGKDRDRAGEPDMVIPDTLVAPQASDPSTDTASDCAETLRRGTTLPIDACENQRPATMLGCYGLRGG